MKELKVGDRVRVYGHRAFDWLPTVGTVSGFLLESDEDGSGMQVEVTSKGRPKAYVHPKQCRRLVEKPQRRVWVPANALAKGFEEFDTTCITRAPEVGTPGAWVEFVEAKRRKP